MHENIKDLCETLIGDHKMTFLITRNYE